MCPPCGKKRFCFCRIIATRESPRKRTKCAKVFHVFCTDRLLSHGRQTGGRGALQFSRRRSVFFCTQTLLASCISHEEEGTLLYHGTMEILVCLNICISGCLRPIWPTAAVSAGGKKSRRKYAACIVVGRARHRSNGPSRH